MPRNARENYDSSYFHIMCQGINKEYIFNENYLKEKYRNAMLKFAKENDVNILSYCIMDNHVHIKEIIHDILKEYAVKINEVSLHKELMEKVVLNIKIRTKISNTEIANIIGVNRMKVQRIINSYLKNKDSAKHPKTSSI